MVVLVKGFTRSKKGWHRFTQFMNISFPPKRKITFNLQSKLLFMMLLLVIIMISVVGIFSYNKASVTTRTIIENRLERETETIYDIAKNLKFSFIRDNVMFEKRLRESINIQFVGMQQDDMATSIYLLKNDSVTPFKMNSKDSLRFSSDQKKRINELGNGVLRTEIDDIEYTLAFKRIQELNGI